MLVEVLISRSCPEELISKYCIPYKKVSGHVRLPPPGVELGSSKDCYLLKYYNVQKRGSRFNLGLETAKNMRYN